jgi:hypothetical protein
VCGLEELQAPDPAPVAVRFPQSKLSHCINVNAIIYSLIYSLYGGAEAETELDGLRLAEPLAEALALGERLAEPEADALADGDRLAEGDRDALPCHR